MTKKSSSSSLGIKTSHADAPSDSAAHDDALRDARASSNPTGEGANAPFIPEIMRFDLLYARIRQATGCATEADLAAFLHVAPAEVTEAVARERLPSGWITRLLVEHHVSPLWVCYGRGPMRVSKELPAEDSESGALLEGMLRQCEGIYQMMQKIRDMRENDLPPVSGGDRN